MKTLLFKQLIPFLFISCCCLVSCTTLVPEPIENYKGAVVYSKFYFVDRFELKIKTEDTIFFKCVNVHRFDYNRYAVGDTIKN